MPEMAHVVGSQHVEAVLLKAEILDHGAAYVADADEDDGEVAVHAEYAGDLAAQTRDIVAVALLAEFAEAAEVLTDLAAGQSHLTAELSGGDAVDAGGLELVQLAQITRQAAYYVIGHFRLFHCISHHQKSI